MRESSLISRLFTSAATTALNGAILGFFVVLGVFYTYSRDLPDPARLAKYEPPIITRLYANDGRLMAEYATEHRLYLPLDAIPRRVIDAVLSAEDKNFYQHGGIDFTSLVRAALTNLNNIGAGRGLVGGSTITQQVVKNFLLTNEKSLERKVKEAILAFRIDRIYSKDRILELYLNQIYLGGGSYGVAAAALNYFNKSLEELTVAEAAFLAALPKAPSTYNPKRNYERAKARRDWVIGRMREDGKITAMDAELAIDSPITLSERDPTEVADAPFFAEEVRRRLADMYGSDVLYKGGLFVKTTLDPELQDYADKSLRLALTDYDRRHGYRGPVANIKTLADWRVKLEDLSKTTPLFEEQRLGVVDNVGASSAHILLLDGEGDIPIEEMKWAQRFISTTEKGPGISKPGDVLMVADVVLVEPQKNKQGKPVKGRYRLLQIPKVNGGMVVLDPHTGRVLALCGGYSAMGSQFNRATQARRQPGSAFKPFVYLAGLEAGYTPASILWDSPISLPQGAGLPDWTPQNYGRDFLGPVPFRIGVEKSRNAMTVYLASKLGIGRIREIGKRMGIYDNLPAEYSAVLGSRETTLVQLVNAYAMLVNGGRRVMPSPIERIDDRYGKIIFRRDQRECQGCQENTVPDSRAIGKTPPPIVDNRMTVIDRAVAYQMVSVLQGVVERGTAVRARSLGMPLGGKTGTTNDSRDTWFIGFSPDLVVGLYIGFDQPKPMGKKETGSSVALPGFIDFMGQAAKDKPSRAFTIPPGIQLVKVNRWTGRPAYDAPSSDVILEAFRTRTIEEGTEIVPVAQPTGEPGNRYYPRDPNWPGYELQQPQQPAPAVMFDEGEESYGEEANPSSDTMPPIERLPRDDMLDNRYAPAPQTEDRLNRRHDLYTPNQGTGGLY